ncbi:hypothetical protein C7H83_06770 [Tetragenococcus halophilus]|uniref:Uncharacterized protein n=1 Tax=Tetragenococcus halophilus TaxID=51669 RepID=A0A3G5FIL1_TETHA|nr:hypothetical protein [Tetragenococcus halophilus]AYW50182.1 hypothetical protein C7H83_06770 [Tetragenococcus halophilus]GBD63777.1 hypothetical protein TEHD23766T_1204 [Tetragenococcus halophilus subsp. flandriensis]
MAVTSKKVEAGAEIKAADHNTLVDDVTALDEGLGQKADTSDVNGKADKTYVDTELSKKANSSSLSGKANTSDLNKKADQSDLEALESRITALESPAE